MTELWTVLRDKVKTVAMEWAAYAALGSFFLYLLGYLVLRFHLTVLGIGADLHVLDERYLFDGARFLVYLLTTVPTVVLLGLLLAALVYGVVWLLVHTPAATALRRGGARLRAWCWHPVRLPLSGVVLAVLMVQLVMRQCLMFSNLLLASSLPPPAWLGAVVLAPTDGLRALYFAALVVATALSAGLFWGSQRCGPQPGWSLALHSVLGVLVVMQALLLPVNYGILVVGKTVPRVATLGDQKVLAPGQEAWLVWEGKDSMTYLLRQRRAGQDVRALVTLPRSAITRLELIGYDPILTVLFAGPSPQAPAAPPQSKQEN